MQPAGGSCVGSSLVSVLRGAYAEPELLQLEALVADVHATGPARFVKQQRNFGSGYNQSVGHTATFLHGSAPSDIHDRLQLLAVEAAAHATGWGVDNLIGANHKEGMPTVSTRCCEFIEYFPAVQHGTAGEHVESALSWHNDGATLFTIGVALSTAGTDFKGGALHIRAPRSAGGDASVRIIDDLSRGDVAVWPGSYQHRVSPILSGRRQVVVVELWLGPPASADLDRPPDTPFRYFEVQQLANTLRRAGEDAAAWRLFEAVISGQLEHFGAAHPNTLYSQGQLALMLRELGGKQQQREARHLYSEMIEAQGAAHGMSHRSTLETQALLCELLQESGMVEAAAKSMEQLLRGQTERFGADHHLTQATERSLQALSGM